MNHISSFFIGAGTVLLSLFTFIVCFLKYPGKSKNREQNKRQCEELEDIPVETIKFQCIGCTDNVAMLKCAECLQPVNGCDQCVRRLPSCDCDLKPFQCKKPTLPKTQCYEDLIRQQKREEKELELQNASEWNGKPEICSGEQIGNSIASFMSPAAYSTMLSVQTERDRCSAAMASTSIDKWLQDGSSPELDQVPWSDIKRERRHGENPLRCRGDESDIQHDWKCPNPNSLANYQPVKRTANFNLRELDKMQNDNNQSERQRPIIRTIANQSKGNSIASFMSPAAYSSMLPVQTERDRSCAAMASTSNSKWLRDGSCPELDQVAWSDIKRERTHWENPLRNHRYESNTARDGKCQSPNCQSIRRTAPFNYHESNANNQSERQHPIIRTIDNQSKGNFIASVMSPADFPTLVSIQNEQKCGCGTIDRLKTAEKQSPELTELPSCEIQKEKIHWMKRLQQYREQKTKAKPKVICEDEYLAKAKALYSKARDTRQPREEVAEKDTIDTGRGYSIGQYCREYNIVKDDMVKHADGTPSMRAANQSESAASIRAVH